MTDEAAKTLSEKITDYENELFHTQGNTFGLMTVGYSRGFNDGYDFAKKEIQPKLQALKENFERYQALVKELEERVKEMEG